MYNKINNDEKISSRLDKATDLYDCGTATFGIAKGNIQSVLTLVFRDPGGKGGWGGGWGGGITTIFFTERYH
jgi:hypothetical protein